LPFDKPALARIHRLSGGVPRRINLLADRALLGAYAQGLRRADSRTVEQAAREVFGRQPATLPAGWRAALVPGLLGLLVLIGAGLLWALLRPAALPGAGAVAGVAGPASGARVTAASALAPASASASASAPALAGLAATSPVLAPTAAADPAALRAAAHPDIATAWRELALRWNVAIGEGEACAAALQARLACFRSAGGGLGVVRQLERPVVLMLQGAEGRVVHALLVALDDRQATLQSGTERFVLPLAMLAGLWRGEFATFWRLPPGWTDGGLAGTDPAARAWLDRGLADAGFGPERPLADRVWAFQLAQGLPPDGRAGPLTVMRLNRLAGVDEPRLGN
jgi:general secretion pathway protein A